MKKIEARSLAEYFGARLLASKIKDREVRIAIVRLYGSLAKANKEIGEEQEDIRKPLVEGHDEEIKKYAELREKARNEKLDEKERKKATKEADAMTECVRIEKDYLGAVDKLLNEECDADIKKVPLEVLYEALSDCGFIGFENELPISAVEIFFKPVISND